MEYIRGKTSAEIDADGLAARVAGYDDVLIDVGTGDGRYVVHVAWTLAGTTYGGHSAKRPPTCCTSSPMRSRCPRSWVGWRRRLLSTSPGEACSRGWWMASPCCWRGLPDITRAGAALEVRLNGGALAESGYTLETGTARVRRALQEGGFDVGELLWLDARELRQCHTTWAKRLAYGRDPRRAPEGNARESCHFRRASKLPRSDPAPWRGL